MTESNHPLIVDLFEEIEQIHNILVPNNQRKLSNVQLSIMVLKRVEAMKIYFNRLNATREIPIEELTAAYEKILRKVWKILVNKPAENPELYWYELEMMRCMLAGGLMAAWGKGGFLRVTGSAQALAEILLGIEVIDFRPILVDFPHPEFRARTNLAINYTNMAAGLLYIASTSLYTISRQYLENWAMIAIRGNEQYLILTERTWNIPNSRKIDKTIGRNQSHAVCYATFSTFNQMIRYLLLLQARLGGQWPEEAKAVAFLDTSNHETFLNSLQKLSNLLQNYIDDFLGHVEKGTFDPNDNPLDNPSIQNSLERTKLSQLTLKGLLAIHELAVKKNKEAITDLEAVIQEILAFLKEKEESLNNPQFLVSNYGEVFQEHLEYFTFFLGMYSIQLETLTFLEDFEKTVGVFFSKEGIERFPKLRSLFLTAFLTVTAKLNKQKLTLKIARKIVKLASHFNPFQPRDFFACMLLGHLTKLSLGREDPETFMKAMNKALKTIAKSSDKSLISEIEQYLKAVEKATNGEEELSYNLKRISNPSPFEPYSLLIPDLASYAREQGYGKIIYLPFNLVADYVIRRASAQ